jgi:hypothetical protein
MVFVDFFFKCGKIKQKIKFSLKRILPSSRHLEFFEKLLCTRFTSYQHQMNAKKDLKNVGYSQSYVKKSDFDPPFRSNRHFVLN